MDNQNRKQVKKLAQYSGVAGQMIGSVGLMALIGWWLDEYYQTEKPYFTMVFSLLGVIAGLYFVVKEVTKK